jgi:hypothetical protein
MAWRTPAQWWRDTVAQYQLQRAMGERDSFYQREIAAYDKSFAEAQAAKKAELGDSANTPEGQVDLEIHSLQFRRDYTERNGLEGKMQEADTPMVNISMDNSDEFEKMKDTPERKGKGIGAWFGRLFSGRFTKAQRDAGAAAFERGNRGDLTFSRNDETRLEGLSQQKAGMEAARQAAEAQAAAEKQAVVDKSKDALSAVDAHPDSYKNRLGAFWQAMADDQKAKGNANVPDKPDKEWAAGARGNYRLERQTPAFMKPGPENADYNLRVLRALNDTDEKGQSKDQEFLKGVVSEAVGKFSNYDAKGLDAKNLTSDSNFARFPEIDAMYSMGHLISDVTKKGGVLTPETVKGIFPTQNDYQQFIDKRNFVMGTAAVVRAELIKQVDYDPQYLKDTEISKGGKESADSLAKMATSPAGLQGAKSYDEYVSNRAAAPQLHALAAPTVAEPTVAASAMAEEKEAVSFEELNGPQKIANETALESGQLQKEMGREAS